MYDSNEVTRRLLPSNNENLGTELQTRLPDTNRSLRHPDVSNVLPPRERTKDQQIGVLEHQLNVKIQELKKTRSHDYQQANILEGDKYFACFLEHDLLPAIKEIEAKYYREKVLIRRETALAQAQIDPVKCPFKAAHFPEEMPEKWYLRPQTAESMDVDEEDWNVFIEDTKEKREKYHKLEERK
jgi:hypothetical protein